jgi:hypothetical protein
MMALGEAKNFESELELFEPLCIQVVITHVLTTTRDTAVTEIPERRLFRMPWMDGCQTLI